MATLTGTPDNDTLLGGPDADLIEGLGGNDILAGGLGDDDLRGGEGDDLLWGGVVGPGGPPNDGHDLLDGGAGSDVAVYLGAYSAVTLDLRLNGQDQDTGGGGVDRLTSIENLIGSVYGDYLIGDSGANVLQGEAGNDTLYGGAGNDTLIGGPGDDAIWVEDAGDVVTELAGEGFDTVAVSINYTLSANVEQLILIGTALEGTGNDDANMIIGNAAYNTLRGLGGDDVLDGKGAGDTMIGGTGNDAYWVDRWDDVVTELAGEGFDTIATTEYFVLPANVEQLILLGPATYAIGNASDNVLQGNGLNNTLDGKAGGDVMIGGLGDDAYWVDNAGDQPIEQAGQGFDTIASYIDYVLPANFEQLILVGAAATATGNADANLLNGNASANTLTGLGGDDVLAGNAGADTMIGGQGNDAYWVENVNDVVTELAGEGFDSVASTVSLILSANVEQLTLIGTATVATGNALANILTGNGLDNVLIGGLGNDLLTGGAGADRFFMTPGDGDDRITDFGSGADAIDVSGYIAAAINWSSVQQGADTLLSFDNGDSVLLQNYLQTNLHQSGDYLLA